MSTATQALATLLPVLYLVGALLYGMELGGPRAPQPGKWRLAASLTIAVGHLFYLACIWVRLGHFPVASAWHALSLLALALLLVYLPLEHFTRTPSTGVFILGFAFILQLLASAFGPLHPAPSELAQSPFFVVHVGTALFALAALFLSGFYGGLYLLLLRQIRRRHFGVLFSRLPDLERLSRLNRGAASMGFILLTAGLNLGIWWAHSGGVDEFNYLDPKVSPMVLLWLVFGLIGASRWVRFLSGRRAALVAVTAASLLVLAVLVSFLPLGSFHSFG